MSNAVIGAVPEHPFIWRAMQGLHPSVKRHWGRFLALQTVHYLTDLLGPIIDGMTRDGVLVLPSRTFYPRSIAGRRRGDRVTGGPDTYAVHHWAHSRSRDRHATPR